MTSQADLFSAPTIDTEIKGVTEGDKANLRAHLASHGWQTRHECCSSLVWEERKLRAVAESLGSDVVRCQLGYKLTETCTRDDVSAALQACDAFESQAKKNLSYSTALRRRLHSLIG
jgi:hypothetical protein